MSLRTDFSKRTKQSFDPKGQLLRNVEAILDEPHKDSDTLNLMQLLPADCKRLFNEGEFDEVISYAMMSPHDRIMRYVWAYACFMQDDIDTAITLTKLLLDENNHHLNIHQLMRTLHLKKLDLPSAECEQIYAMFSSRMEPSIVCEYISMLSCAMQDLESAYFMATLLVKMYPGHLQALTYLSSVQRLINIRIFHYYDRRMNSKLRKVPLSTIRIANYSTRNCDILFETSRKYIYNIITKQPGNSLTIIGAGNGCNFDIIRLQETFNKIHLVDYDKYALGYTRRTQNLEKDKTIKWSFDLDLSEILEQIYLWKFDPPTISEISDIIEKTFETPRRWSDRTDIVVIDCIFSTLLFFLDENLGSGHREFQKLFDAIIIGSYQRAIDGVDSGGTLISIQEQVSSEYYEPLLKICQNYTHIIQVVDNLKDNQDKINPYLSVYKHRQLLLNDPSLSLIIESIEISPSWLWFYPGINYISAALIINLKK